MRAKKLQENHFDAIEVRGCVVDQKDERKPIARAQRPETSGGKMGLGSSYFFLLTSLARRSSCEGG
jgi:hypothetical protein